MLVDRLPVTRPVAGEKIRTETNGRICRRLINANLLVPVLASSADVTMAGSEILLKTLEDEGVEVIF